MGMEAVCVCVCVCVQRGIKREEVEKTIARLKCGKAAGVDGRTAEMLEVWKN